MKPPLFITPLLFLFLSVSGCTNPGIRDNLATGADIITPALMKQHISFLASDSMMGRDTPSPQLDSAASYIAAVFRSSRLQNVNGSYFEKVNLGIINLGDDNHLKISKNNSEKSFKIKSEFTPFDLTGDNEVTAPVIFAGYGITAPEYKYDDYERIDAEGKIVLVMKHEPGEEDSNSVFNGTGETLHSNISEKVSNAISHGAIGVLIVTDPLNHGSLAPRGFPWPSLSKTLPKDALPMVLIDETKKRVPVVQVGEEIITSLFGNVDRLSEIQSRIDSAVQPSSFEFKEITLSLKTTTVVEDKSSRNVVGYLEGADPKLKEELVVIGAHYDHVGYLKQHSDTADYIFNGADDNASGTAAVIAVAQAFGSSGPRPKRSLLFIAFAGEEKGLMGSKAYINKPLFPLEKTVAMLNIDMIGRNGDDTLWMVNEVLSPDLSRINREENSRVGLHLLDEENLQGGSDHMSFQNKGIPFLFYHSGLHSDLHKVSDGPEKINSVKAARAAQLVFWTAWRIANEDDKYSLMKQK